MGIRLRWLKVECMALLPISCDDMSNSEKTSFIQFLVTESNKKDQQNHHLQRFMRVNVWRIEDFK